MWLFASCFHFLCLTHSPSVKLRVFAQFLTTRQSGYCGQRVYVYHGEKKHVQRLLQRKKQQKAIPHSASGRKKWPSDLNRSLTSSDVSTKRMIQNLVHKMCWTRKWRTYFERDHRKLRSAQTHLSAICEFLFCVTTKIFIDVLNTHKD